MTKSHNFEKLEIFMKKHAKNMVLQKKFLILGQSYFVSESFSFARVIKI